MTSKVCTKIRRCSGHLNRCALPRNPFRCWSGGVIKVKENESIEQALRRFKKACEKAGILTELRRREYYDKPSIRKKKKAAAARKRAIKKMRRMVP